MKNEYEATHAFAAACEEKGFTVTFDKEIDSILYLYKPAQTFWENWFWNLRKPVAKASVVCADVVNNTYTAHVSVLKGQMLYMMNILGGDAWSVSFYKVDTL